MLLVIICFESRSSEAIADAKTGSMSIAFAIRTGREGPVVFRNEIILFFFSCTSIIVLRAKPWL